MNRIPSEEEMEANRQAWFRAQDLEQVEPGMERMTMYWFSRWGLLRSAATGDPKLVLRYLKQGTGIYNGTTIGSVWDGIEKYNVACAAAGTVTRFSELPVFQPWDWWDANQAEL